MKKFDQANKMLEKMKSENLVSYTERALRARITFAGERLSIVNGMIIKEEDMKVKGSQKYAQEREMFLEGRQDKTNKVVALVGKGKVTKSNMQKIIAMVTTSNDAVYDRHC